MLLVDVGNSSVTVAACRPPRGADPAAVDARDLAVEPLGAHPLPADPDGRRRLADALASRQADLGLRGAAVASVVPALDAALREALEGVWQADHRAALPFAVAVSDPASVGADRYCNVAAAAGSGWSSALVVDAGTATTFDVLTDGVFVGGLIAPGIRLAAETLGGRAARLSPVAPEPSPARPAPDTVGAMAAGAYLTGVHGIAGTIDALLAAGGERPVVLTGGLAPLLTDERGELPGRASWRHDPHWTLRGLALLALRNGIVS